MDFLDENLNALKIKNEDLYDKIHEYIDRKEMNLNAFSMVETRDGKWSVEIKKNEKKIRLNSLYNTEREAAQWIKQFDFSNIDTDVVMFGISNGIFVREILKNLDENSVIILIEPNIDLFIFCMYKFDIRDIISDIRVLFVIKEKNWEKFRIYLASVVDLKRLNSFIFCCHPKMEYIYSIELKEVKDAIVEHINKLHLEYNTRAVLGDFSLENSLKNLHFLKNINFVEELRGIIPDNIPFIIVAAGPSLDKNVDELKKAEGKAFILVVDRAVRDVIKHNINFDAIITVDAGKSSEYMNNEKCYKYPIFACDDSKNELLELNYGRKIYIVSTIFIDKLCRKYGIQTEHYPVGGSVATAAFNIARVVGSKKIILVGQDLAYAGELTHAGGEREKHLINDEIFFVDGIDGKKVKTRADWLRFLDWYGREIKELDDGIEVIDATEGGAKIDGTKVMNLSEVVRRYCITKFDFKQTLKNLPFTFDEKKYLEVRQDLLHLEVELFRIKECAKKGIYASDKILDELKKINYNSEKINRYAKTVKKMNEVIEEQSIFSIVNEYIKPDIEYIMMDVNCVVDDEKENIKETCRISKFVYQKISSAVYDIEPLLKESLKKV